MQLLKNIPLFLYLLIIYNVLAFAGVTAGGVTLNTEAYQLSLPTGPTISFSVGDGFLILGVVALYIEIFKATRSSNASIFDHLFSMLTFVGFLVEFLMVAEAATASFFILMMMALLDVIAGFTVTISTARRDVEIGSGH